MINTSKIIYLNIQLLYHIITTIILLMLNSCINAQNQKIVICGCGITGSIISNLLANQKLIGHNNEVYVYEAGRGPGGRTSTRHYKEFNFDHGAQYIKESNNVYVKSWLDELHENNIIKNWKGYFMNYIKSGNETSIDINQKNRYVGYPTMSNICKYSIKLPDIKLNFNCRIKANYNEVNGKWNIYDAISNNLLLDNADWLISTDKSSFLSLINSNTLSSSNHKEQVIKDTMATTKLLDDQQKIMSCLQTVPILSAMIVLKSSLPIDIFPYDSITISELTSNILNNNKDNNNIDNNNQMIGWISRDSSKPGRERSDNKECWVVQSTTEFAKKVINDVNKTMEANGNKYTSEELKSMVNKVANEKLVEEFIDIVVKLSEGKVDNNSIRSMIETSIGHRWGAALPIFNNMNTTLYIERNNMLLETIKKYQLHDNHYDDSEIYCYVNNDMRFAAAGDYFNINTLGRIDGAYLSGKQVVDIITSIQQYKK